MSILSVHKLCMFFSGKSGYHFPDFGSVSLLKLICCWGDQSIKVGNRPVSVVAM